MVKVDDNDEEYNPQDDDSINEGDELSYDSNKSELSGDDDDDDPHPGEVVADNMAGVPLPDDNEVIQIV